MTEQLEALVGMHDPTMCRIITRLLQTRGYNVTTVSTILEMRAAMNPQDNAPAKEYAHYHMDVNLGVPFGTDLSPAQEVYDRVRDRVEAGNATFMTQSGSQERVDAALEQSLPCKISLDIPSYLNTLNAT
jgi:hypothetical protein